MSDKRKKINIVLISIVAVLVSVFILFNQTLVDNETEGITKEEVLSISQNEKIEILNYENISKKNSLITIISYKSDDEIGSIEATKNGDKVDYSKVVSVPIIKNKKIEVVGTQSLGYLIVTFFDNELLNKTSNIKVTYNNEIINRDINTKKRSVIISIPDYLLEDGKVYQPYVELYNKDSTMIYNYPSDESGALLDNVDYYDFYYSKKTMNLLKEEKVDTRINENTASINDNPGMYDLWLYVMSVNLKDDTKIINFVEELYSGDGFYYSNLREIDDNNKKNPFLYLLDTKMALEIYKKRGLEVPEQSKIINYLKDTIQNLNAQSGLDFVSKGSYIYLISQIEEIIGREKPSKNIELIYFKDLTSLYSKALPSLDKYYTAINLLTVYPDLGIKLDNEDVYRYIKQLQLDNGFFNISGYSEGYDILATYIAVDILRVIHKQVPRKEKLIKNLETITDGIK
ncbi:hypothetical protein [Paenibacillus sp. W2I17]|uniref:hypothetical protein n=1 Tax=Paenibacillus sp. W2I17 TaxID=3042311 RepID=UPI002789F341|nr:hypothetical protein [Paenibacillus sp. W2I17]MDQ0659679.1 hypothetical protein [Paenibacillus sp. W2I17]